MAKRIKVKPSKEQSKFGFIVGIGFVLIGCIVVIPIFGPFGILWTVAAGFIAYSHYRNAYTDKGMPTKEIIIDEDSNPASFSGSSPDDEMDIEAKLKKLESLYNQGLISHDEYQKKREEFLKEF